MACTLLAVSSIKLGDVASGERWQDRALKAGAPIDYAKECARALLEEGYKDQSLRWYERIAEAGEPSGWSAMVSIHLESRDLTAAEKVATRAAECGHPHGLALVGQHLVRREFARSDWSGLPIEAMIELGERQNRALHWLVRAADLGEPGAIALLESSPKLRARGLSYREGDAPVREAQKEGCYVATAVYGSYDAAPVLTLRRFRDEVLARRVGGRLAIRAYYRVSPGLVRRYGRNDAVRHVVRRLLDLAVQGLEAKVLDR